MKTIVFFNHKGGVSKTTNVFYFGWMLAELGKTVLLVDADPQCNLTGLVVSRGDFDRFEQFYVDNPEQNIKAGLRPVFEGQMAPLAPVPTYQVPGCARLHLLPGHLQLSEYDITLTLAQELTSSLYALKNVPGAASALLRMTGQAIGADLILVDLNPSLSALNQNFLLTADHFVIPNSPDYFSLMAIKSLARILPRWASWYDSASQHAILRDATYKLTVSKPTFVGTLVQNFRLRGGAPTIGFQSQIDLLSQAVETTLATALHASGMMLPEAKYLTANNRVDYCLGLVPDFNTLSTTSQSGSTPVFALTESQLGQGVVLAQNLEKRADFHALYETMAQGLLDRIS